MNGNGTRRDECGENRKRTNVAIGKGKGGGRKKTLETREALSDLEGTANGGEGEGATDEG